MSGSSGRGPGKPAIVVLGMVTLHPVPGVIWQTIQYVLGFERLGYEVYYVEAHGRTPSMLMHGPADDGSALAAAFLKRIMGRFGLSDRWAFHALHAGGACYGMSIEKLRRLYRDAHLVINLHAATVPLPEHYATGRLVCLETDPVHVQIELSRNDQAAIEYFKPHVAFFTFGENYGNRDCGLPVNDLFAFRPTRQPILLDFWERTAGASRTSFRTIASWRQHKDVVLHGELYSWSKHHEFLKFADLPRRTGQRFEAALAKVDEPHRKLLESKGWELHDALAFGADIDAYRAFIHGARGEFSVAKDQNIRLRTGWFSDRSASFLASGLPVVVQDTAFGRVLPVGQGLLSFRTFEEAAHAVQRVCAEPLRHEQAALEIAREFFSYEVVLGRLLADVDMSVEPGGGGHRGATRTALPPSLVLHPVSRHPIVLDPSTVGEVLGQPLPTARRLSRGHRSGPPTSSIVVVARDNLLFNRMCLETVLHADGIPPEVIVIDNASGPETRDYFAELAARQPSLHVISNSKNRSFAAAVNQGLSVARGSTLVILNNDVIVTPGWLRRLAAHLQDPAVGLVGPLTNRSGNESEMDVSYTNYGGLLELGAERARKYPGEATELSTAMMFCTAMRRDTYARIGPLDEAFTVGLLEDDDYSLRVREAGMRVICAEDVFVHHFGQASFGDLVSSGRYAELLETNRRRFEAKWSRRWEPHPRRRSEQWQLAIDGIRELVAERIPEGAVVLVVNRGDDALLKLGLRTGWPFPRNRAGEYAGYYPAGDAEAIEHLEIMRALGATHLIFPSTELWWLEHYATLREHLETRHRELTRTAACVIYALRDGSDR